MGWGKWQNCTCSCTTRLYCLQYFFFLWKYSWLLNNVRIRGTDPLHIVENQWITLQSVLHSGLWFFIFRFNWLLIVSYCSTNQWKKKNLHIGGPLQFKGFPGGSDGKESTCNVGDKCSIPGWGRSTEEGNGYPLQYSGLENSMDRGTWQATVHVEWLTHSFLQFKLLLFKGQLYMLIIALVYFSLH